MSVNVKNGWHNLQLTSKNQNNNPLSLSELFGERTNVISPSGLVERDGFYRTLGKMGSSKQVDEEEAVTFSEKMDKLNKEKNKQEEFFEPVREYVSESDIQGMGFDARKFFSYGDSDFTFIKF